MSTFANLVRVNARALTAVSRLSVRYLSSRASITRPTLLHQTLPVNAARRWMSYQSRTAEPRKVLYFANLPFKMMEDDLRYELQDFGVITDVFKGTDPSTGRSNGWARVEFETEEAAESVMRGHLERPFLFNGRPATIEWAKHQTVAPGPRMPMKGCAPTSTLFVGNLAFRTTEQDVREIFAQFGPVKAVSLPRGSNGISRAYAHVEFYDLATATLAYDASWASPIMLHGRDLRVDYPLSKPKQSVNRNREWD